MVPATINFVIGVVIYMSSVHAVDENPFIPRCTKNAPRNLVERALNGDERCQFKLETGPCRALMMGYYFDWNILSCREGVYGGCAGCQPFAFLQECQQACSPYQLNVKRANSTEDRGNSDQKAAKESLIERIYNRAKDVLNQKNSGEERSELGTGDYKRPKSNTQTETEGNWVEVDNTKGSDNGNKVDNGDNDTFVNNEDEGTVSKPEQPNNKSEFKPSPSRRYERPTPTADPPLESPSPTRPKIRQSEYTPISPPPLNRSKPNPTRTYYRTTRYTTTYSVRPVGHSSFSFYTNTYYTTRYSEKTRTT